jgi:hypothetical protein
MLTLQAVLGDATADHAEGHVLVSIYESGSSDDTPKFLAVMEVLLLAVGEWVRVLQAVQGSCAALQHHAVR